MKNPFANTLARKLVQTSDMVRCAKMNDKDILVLASQLDKTYVGVGKQSAQGDKLRNYVECRKRNLQAL